MYGLLIYALCASKVLGALVELPPIAQPANAEHHTGKMIWADLTTPNLAGAEQFYAGLFGWSFHDFHMGDGVYAVAFLDGRPVSGLLQKAVTPGDNRQPIWLTLFAVRDVGATKRAALEHGGKVVFGPTAYPQRGAQAVLTDPDGAVFGVLASSSGDPPDYLAAPGEWIWSSLFADDADAEAAFYRTLFGCEVFDLPSDDGLEHMILSTGDYARAGVNALPNDSHHRHPHWLNFVWVVNAADMAAKAVSLGGRVLVEPRNDRHGGKLAVIADPAGAPVGLMEWPETVATEEPR